ncbi:acyloxyacyl hydrolase [Endothiovibrio diazotrophicus]
MGKAIVCGALASALVLAATVPARGMDGAAVTIGGGDDTELARVGLQWDWDKRWFDEGDWYVTGLWEAEAGVWSNGGGADLSFTPVFQLKPKSESAPYPFFELGIGAHLLSDEQLDNRDMGGVLHLGTHLGVGYRFGDHNRWELAYRFQHLSNAGIEDPNPGIEFHVLRLGYHY